MNRFPTQLKLLLTGPCLAEYVVLVPGGARRRAGVSSHDLTTGSRSAAWRSCAGSAKLLVEELLLVREVYLS